MEVEGLLDSLHRRRDEERRAQNPSREKRVGRRFKGGKGEKEKRTETEPRKTRGGGDLIRSSNDPGAVLPSLSR